MEVIGCLVNHVCTTSLQCTNKVVIINTNGEPSIQTLTIALKPEVTQPVRAYAGPDGQPLCTTWGNQSFIQL
jgi:hypothetical protein